jgi:hypothetical protein
MSTIAVVERLKSLTGKTVACALYRAAPERKMCVPVYLIDLLQSDAPTP